MEPIETKTMSEGLDEKASTIYVLNVNKFIILYIITFGLYNAWWIYKSWLFFKDKDKSEIMPAIRTIFSIIFLIPLFIKILKFAKNLGYTNNYNSFLLFAGYLITCFLGYLPEPYFFVVLFSFVYILPPFNAFNFAIMHCEGYKVIEQNKFNNRQMFLIIIGSILWILVLLGLII